MRTTINIDDEVMENVMRLSHSKSRSDAIRIALQEYIRQQRRRQVLELRGTLDIEDNWEALRKLEMPE